MAVSFGGMFLIRTDTQTESEGRMNDVDGQSVQTPVRESKVRNMIFRRGSRSRTIHRDAMRMI